MPVNREHNRCPCPPTYQTLDGTVYSLETLPTRERRALAAMLTEYQEQPDWVEFEKSCLARVRELIPTTPSGRERFAKTALWRVVEDLASRLGIAGGHVAEPGLP